MTTTQPATEERRAYWREKDRRRWAAMSEEERRARWREKGRRRAGYGGSIYDGSAQVDPASHATHCLHCAAALVLRGTDRYRVRKYCSVACSNRAAGKARDRQASEPTRRNYNQRAQRAPGLTMAQRSRLLHRWRQQGRSCAYCPRPASTVDHVIPLIRGGTHWEGNLAPCCRPCNSSKAHQFLIEWQRWVR